MSDEAQKKLQEAEREYKASQDAVKAAMNLSPEGRDIGFKRTTAIDQAFDPQTVAMIGMITTASKMEDNTERTINDIENLRRETLRKAEVGPQKGGGR